MLAVQAVDDPGHHPARHRTPQVPQVVAGAATAVEVLGAERDEAVAVDHQASFADVCHHGLLPASCAVPIAGRYDHVSGLGSLRMARLPARSDRRSLLLTSAARRWACSQASHNRSSLRPVTAVTCRFDDLRAGRAWVLDDLVDELVASDVGQVRSVVDQLDAAIDAGLWVGGVLTFEAAPAFDPALVALSPATGGSRPVAWFGVFRRRRPAEPLVASNRSGPEPACLDLDGHWTWETSPSEHHTAVEEVRRRIGAGDVYQVNLTTRLRRPWPAPPSAAERLYRALAVAQRGCGHALLALPGLTVVSASPELFFALDGRRLACRPMKGTAARGAPLGGRQDVAAADRLQRSAKDRAENVMIVDLVRNDLGRIAEVGTVSVPALFAVEAFPTVWQLTSTVTAELMPGTGLAAVFAALFPCGSVTGAPKAAAMAAIAALEPSPRGVYCGAVGWAGPGPAGPQARFAVAIRTLVIDHHRAEAHYGVGGGITWSSTPEDEWDEMVAKAAVLGRCGLGAPGDARRCEVAR